MLETVGVGEGLVEGTWPTEGEFASVELGISIDEVSMSDVVMVTLAVVVHFQR